MSPDEIIKARERLGWTQAQLADALGVQMNTVWRWEHGYHPMSKPYVRLLQVLLAANVQP